MKVIEIDCELYLYPEGVSNLVELQDYLNNCDSKFIMLKVIDDMKGLRPYFIEGAVYDVLLCISTIGSICEKEIEFIKEEEYIKKLKTLASINCKDCVYYGDECITEKLETYIDKLCLDGECEFKEVE